MKRQAKDEMIYISQEREIRRKCVRTRDKDTEKRQQAKKKRGIVKEEEDGDGDD